MTIIIPKWKEPIEIVHETYCIHENVKKNSTSWHIVIKHMPDWLKVFDDDKIHIHDAAQIHRW